MDEFEQEVANSKYMKSNQNDSHHLQWRIQDFPLGGGGADPLGGCQPPMRTLFGENICENKRN